MRTKLTEQKTKEITKKKIQRISRPLGFTYLNQQRDKSEEGRTRLTKQVIRIYIDNDFTWNNKPVTIEQLAIQLRIETNTLTNELFRQGKQMGDLMFGKGTEDATRACIFWGFKKILEDKAQISLQSKLLLASQGGQYKPFISSSVNQSLDIGLRATNALLNFTKMLIPSNPTSQILIQNNSNPNSNPTKPEMAIGIKEALNLIESQSQNPLYYISGPNPNSQPIPEGLTDLPEVRANLQQMVDTDGAKLLQKPQHENRRTQELGIVDNDEI